MHSFRQIFPILFLLAVFYLLPSIVVAQAPVASESGVTAEMLNNRIQEVERSGDLDEANKTAVLDIYRNAISLIEQRQAHEASAEQYARAREQAPKQSAALRSELEKLESSAAQKLPDSLSRKSLPALEQQLLSEKADLTGLSTRRSEIQALLEMQARLAEQARERLTQAGKRLPEIEDALQVSLSEGQQQRLAEARRWVLELEEKALGAEIEKLNQELLSQPMRIELLRVQLNMATLELSRQQQYVEMLESLVGERRLSEAITVKQEAEATERQAFGKHPLLQEIAQKNTRLGEELKQLAAGLEAIIREENIVAGEARRIADNFRLARQKLEIAGLSEALGQVLLEQRRALPDAADFRAADSRRQSLVVDSGLRQIRNQQERARLRDINVYVKDLLASLSETWRSLIRQDLLALAEQRRDLLDKAIAADETYLQGLGELDLAQRQLSETVSAYNNFLDERLLWIRTGEPPSWQTLGSVTQTLAIFVKPAHWMELARALVMPSSFPWILLVGIGLFAALTWKAHALRAALKRSGRNVGQQRHDRFLFTIRALLLTLILALAWPILFLALGLHLQYVQGLDSLDIRTHLYQSSEWADWSGQFVPAIGVAFHDIALYTFYFFAFRVFCERGGLAIAHFGWNPEITRQLRRKTRRLMLVFLPAAFLLIASITYDTAALAGGLSRLFFVIVMVALAWFFVQILAPGKGVLRDFYTQNPANPLTWFRYLWLGLAFALPLMLAILATMGFVYTAAQFGARLVDTLWLVVAIILIHQLVVRWLRLTRRRLEFNDALERHRLQRAAKEEAGGESAAGEVEHFQSGEPEIDFRALSNDTSKLISTALVLVAAVGLWVIWSDVLPAFGILDEVSVWQYSTLVDGAEQLVPVTLKDVILGVLTIVIVIAGARRLPALLEIVLLARLNITAGGRYAISSLTQYTIVAVGIIMVFNLLGGSWSEIQWLIAALGVGIGFGLQEIVANFICGLILLFERPIRIGDVVTVGNTDGVVTGIRIRSTTIRNWDRQELLVPNKEFITGRLLNWTLSDPVTRIVIPVGIAYGSDVARSIQLVQEAADEHERVLDDPATLVTFDSFGDNSLTIVLRCFIGSMDYWRQTISELHQAINKKFNDAGIVVAFPQRDIHLDTSKPLDVRIHRVQTET